MPEGVTIRREFCNSRCREAFYRAEKRKAKTCLFCGGPMGAYGYIYCSTTCKNRSGADMRKRRNRGDCARCGKRFMITNEGQKFCSPACYHADKVTRPTLACTVCGEAFRPNLPTQTTCSRTCKGIASRVIPDRPCECCGQVFRPKRTGARFCSRSCSNRGAPRGVAV